MNEDKKDLEAEKSGVVKRWLREEKLACKRDKQWVLDVEEAVDVYRNEKYKTGSPEYGDRRRKESFNIFWSNVETKRPVLYSTPPRPDIRRRFKDKSDLGAAVSEVLERSTTFTFESSDLDSIMIAAVNDLLVPGRAITRVKYVPTFSQVAKMEIDSLGVSVPSMETDGTPIFEDQLDYEEVLYEQWQWDKFKIGPCANWKECPWIMFIHDSTKEQVEKKWGEEWAKRLKFTNDSKTDDNKENLPKDSDPASDDSIFGSTTIWEIWDKETKKVIWMSPTFKDEIMEEEDDPMSLEHFWPIPKPLYAIESSTSTTPTTEYSMYETLAKELEIATNRVRFLLKGLRARGVYDSRISELEKIFEEEDNGFIPLENAEPVMEHGLSSAIWFLPIKEIVEVLMQLYQYRQDTMQSIYQITGISDILRGASNPHETLGAQKIKANFGTKRMERQQKEVQRYARDILRLTVELVSDFGVETLSTMTGLDFPTNEMKQQAQMQLQQIQQQEQMQAQQAQMMGQESPPPQPPDPQIVNILETPSWEEIQEVMTSDIQREYMVDIETNSTIEIDESEDKENMQQLFTAITQFVQAMGPAIEAGAMSKEAGKAILGSIIRRFKFGREVEDALDTMFDEPEQQGPDPEQMKAEMEMKEKQMEMQAKEKEMVMENDFKQKEMQMEMQQSQMQAQIDQQAAQFDLKIQQMEFAQKQREHQMNMEMIARKEKADEEKHKNQMETYRFNKNSGELKRA